MVHTTLITLGRRALFATVLTATLTAQNLTEGFSETTTALPAGSGNVLTTATGTLYFDGINLVHDIAGGTPQTLLTFASFTFGSFTSPIGATKVLFGESSNGGIWSVPLNGTTPVQIANVPFNYDAVMLDDDRALVSAKTGGFAAPDNDVMFVDLLTGQTQLLAQFPGASGPLTVDAAGNVYYATSPSAFPAPAGTVSVLKLSSATIDTAIATNQVLTMANAQVVIAGLDAAGDLAFDDDGDLFFVDWFSGRIGEINDATGNAATVAPTFLDYAGSGLNGSVLQFLPTTSGAAVFEPFQPTAGTLRIHETDYVSISQIRTVQAQRPDLSSSVANPITASSFDLDTVNGPANGIGLLLFTVGAPAGSVAASIPGFEQPLHVDSALATTPVLVPLGFDAMGTATLPISNPGFTPTLAAVAQTVCFTQHGGLGTSAPIVLQISQ